MPYVLKNKLHSEIFSCELINIYDFPYFGAKNWDSLQTATEQVATFLKSKGVEKAEEWEIIEVEEMQLKIFNVKLNNNPHRKLFLDENGKPIIQTDIV